MSDTEYSIPVATNRTRLRKDMRACGATEEEIDRMIGFLPPIPKRKNTKPNYRRGKSKTYQWLLDHIDHQGDDCLIWPFARESRVGRGVIGGVVGGAKRSWAHRTMCELVNGPPPTPLHQAAHNCGNGHEGCVHPKHLEWKTNSQNQIDRYRVHDRGDRPRTNYGFSEADVEAMRAAYAAGDTTQMALAGHYGCSLGTIQYYLKYRERRGHKAWRSA